MISYEFRTLSPDTVRQLTELSGLWVEENCCWGMVKNEEDDLNEPLAVALEGEMIIGYVFGHFYEQKNGTSCIGAGAKCFSVDELYVHPKYRGRGIGKALFRMMENKVRGECEYLTLTTSTKNYRAIMKLYIEELDMIFHSAFLLKSTGNREESPCG